MNDKILRKYIAEMLKEGWGLSYLPDEEDYKKQPKKEKGFFAKIKDFFTGSEFGDVIDDWVEDQEYYHDIVVPDALKDDAEAFLKSKSRKIADRFRGDESRAAALTRKLLDARYSRILRDMAKEQDESL
jgi:hypothetical protein